MQRKKLERWDVKLACGLHLLRKYRVRLAEVFDVDSGVNSVFPKIIRELFGLTAEDAKKKFEGTEYFYFSEPKERFRVGIFKLSFNLSWDDTRSLLSKLDGDEPTDEKALLEYHTLRILKRHGPGSAEKVLAKIHKESQMVRPLIVQDFGTSLWHDTKFSCLSFSGMAARTSPNLIPWAETRATAARSC